ncbi:MAG: translation initiation factor IF-2 subunit gamma, partial [Candidatus Diapherotrites archaeon]|nr:translation initiation factor IF-2 subunit gamma [Candidatus Diapherotrites archaeon]
IPKELKMNESVVLTIGSMSMLGKIVKVKGNRISVKLKKPAAFWKGQNIAISKLYNMRWRLVGYGKVV